MILQSLCGYYDRLADTPALGFAVANVAAYVTLKKDGTIVSVSSLLENKKPIKMQVPQQVKRTVDVAANFLCENSKYVFGTEEKRGAEQLAAFQQLHHDILDSIDCNEAKVLLRFIDNAKTLYETLDDNDKKTLSGGNIVFRLENSDNFLHDDKEIKAAWTKHSASSEKGEKAQCLITGDVAPIARLHGGVGGLAKDKLTIVSFNQSSSESYYKKQGAGAPISETAAFKYVTALNSLVTDKRHRINIAGDKVIFWAEREATKEEDIFGAFFANAKYTDDKKDSDQFVLPLDGDDDKESAEVDESTANEIKALLSSIHSGKKNTATAEFNKDVNFSILGISGNSTRAVIRFFYQNTFGEILDRVLKHYEDMYIVGSSDRPISPWRLLVNTAVAGKSENIPPLLESALMRSILNGTEYPFNLYTAIMSRVKAETKIDFVRAGILKAYLNRNARLNNNKEEITVSLNKSETNKGYLLGRLMAVLEKAQKDAIGDVNASVMDKYLNTAMSNPETVFPTLLKLFQKHLNKSEQYYTNQIASEIIGQFDSNGFPKTLDLNEQGKFLIGYYHQNAELYKGKKNKTNEVNDNE
jgi:CRISPR-associated protein Csd1